MRILAQGKDTIAVLDTDMKIACAQDMLDTMATLCYDHDITGMVVPAAVLGEIFFSLKTGFAGEILQKFSNYQMKVAIVGNFDKYASRPLQDLIAECNRGRQVFFKGSEQEAVEAFAMVELVSMFILEDGETGSRRFC